MAATTPSNQQPNQYQFTDILQGISFESQEEVQKKETGQKLAERIYANQTSQSDNLNFFKARAADWVDLERWALGKQDMRQFLDYFNVSDGNKAYVNIDLTPIMVGPQFVGTLVESMSKNEEYPCVSAIDDGSVGQKEKRKMQALYRMKSPEVPEMEEAAGIKFEPEDEYVPENETAAEIYFKLEDRLPKEIDMEQALESTLIKEDYQNVLKPKLIFDFIVKNAGFTKIERNSNNKACIRKCIPQNMIYNYFQGDTGKLEIGYIGEIYSLKAREIRRKYGMSPSNPKGLTEKEIFELVKSSTQYNVGSTFNYSWIPEYQLYNFNRPWDEFSIPVFDFEIEIDIPEYSVSRIDSFGNENIAPKKTKPNPTSEKSRVIKKDKTRWYRGVYAPSTKKMLYWGLPDIVLIPFFDLSTSLSSYSVNIPFNQGEYIPSLFKRAMEPLREYAITKLKRKQLISKLRPSGIRIDVESARNIDLGNGDSIPWEEVVRIFDQTGNEIWSSRGLDPNQREAPALSATAQDDSIQKIIQLTATLQSCLEDIRALLGVPHYRDGTDVGDRTAAKLAEMQNSSSYNVTDFIQRAHSQLMKETLYKVLLFEWQKKIKSGDEDAEEMINTIFDVDVKMKPTEYQKQLLEQRIEFWSKTPDKYGNPLITPKDVFYLENIKDFKLAQLYLANVIETNRKRHIEESAQLQKQNTEAQMQSNQQTADNTKQLEDVKFQMEMQIKKAEETAKNRSVLLTGIFDMLKSGVQIPAQMMPLVNEVMTNIALPLAVENEETRKAIQEKMQAEQQQQEMQAQQEAQIMQIAQENNMAPEEVVAQLQQQESQQQVA